MIDTPNSPRAPICRSLAALIAVLTAASAAGAADGPVIVLKSAAVHTGDGRVLPGVAVLVRDGKIASVGALADIPSGATVIDLPKGSITPGLIDANARLEPADIVTPPRRQGSALAMMFHAADCASAKGLPCSCDPRPSCALADLHDSLAPEQICPVCGFSKDTAAAMLMSGVRPNNWSQTEASSEVVPHTRLLDALNLRSVDLDRLLRAGVTTVYASPDSSAVIGPRGAILRTGGPVAERVIVPEAAVAAAMGSDPFRVGMGNAPPFGDSINVRTRRPTTRMGVTWVFRKAFYDADEASRGVPLSGADTPPPPALPVLADARAGRVPLRIQARTQHDILTAIRLTDEFSLRFTLVEATEAYKCIAELQSRSIPVVFGPLYIDPSGPRARTSETENARLATLRALLDAGVVTALSAQDLREEDGLARQAMYAVRTGVAPEDALKAVTSTPARLLGIDSSVGTVEPGKRADLVLWSGEPFDATSKPVVVLVGGSIVFDGRAAK